MFSVRSVRMYLKLSEVFKYLQATADSRCIVEGEQVLHANHLILCGKKESSNENIQIVGLCLQTSALQGQPHQIEGIFIIDDGVKIGGMKCTCKAGLSGTCKHISALLLNCTRMNINSLELLSSTDVECYWKAAKPYAKETYKPQPVSEYSCLVKTKNKLKRVRELSADEMRNSLNVIMKAVPDSNLSKHRLRKRKNENVNHSNGLNSNVVCTQMNCILTHCNTSEFLNNLAKDLFIQKYHLEECCLNKWRQIEKCNNLECLMLSQNSEEWHNIRKCRITGSNCYSIFTYNLNKSNECWQRKAKQCFFPKQFSNNYIEHGKNEEKNAIKAYKESSELEIIDNLGIVIPKHFPWLGFSPDALVVDRGTPAKLVEIKCPFIGKTRDADCFVTACHYLKTSPAGLELNKKHLYYGQIQLGLTLLNVQMCDLVIYSSFSKTFLKLEVPFDESFARNMISSITEKYFCKMLHTLCDNEVTEME